VDWIDALDHPYFGADLGAPPRPITIDFDPGMILTYGHDIGTGQTHVRKFNAHRVTRGHFVLGGAASQQLSTGVEVGGQGSHFPNHCCILTRRAMDSSLFQKTQTA